MTELEKVTKTLSEREKIGGIVWLVVGILQVISFAGIICGIWNIINAIKTLKNSQDVLTPWSGIVDSYDSQLTNIIITLVVNLIFGAGFGVAGAIYELIAVRGYVLKNREVFEEAGY